MQATTYRSARIKGNVNYYNIDQFNNPFLPKPDITVIKPEPEDPPEPTPTPAPTPDPDDPDADQCNPCNPNGECFSREECIIWSRTYVQPYDDHVWLNISNTQMAFARTDYYYKHLDDMPDFQGFFPRTYLPQTKLYRSLDNSWEKVTLFFIDSKQEIFTGVGLNFPVCRLYERDMQLDKLIAD